MNETTLSLPAQRAMAHRAAGAATDTLKSLRDLMNAEKQDLFALEMVGGRIEPDARGIRSAWPGIEADRAVHEMQALLFALTAYIAVSKLLVLGNECERPYAKLVDSKLQTLAKEAIAVSLWRVADWREAALKAAVPAAMKEVAHV